MDTDHVVAPASCGSHRGGTADPLGLTCIAFAEAESHSRRAGGSLAAVSGSNPVDAHRVSLREPLGWRTRTAVTTSMGSVAFRDDYCVELARPFSLKKSAPFIIGVVPVELGEQADLPSAVVVADPIAAGYALTQTNLAEALNLSIADVSELVRAFKLKQDDCAVTVRKGQRSDTANYHP